MKKLLTIVGARPQIIKAAALSRTIAAKYPGKIREFILHTGQHYDENMSQVFFDELDIPRPDYQLNVGSASHGEQTARMIVGIEEKLQQLRPDFLVLYGDTNSTLAGAIAAAKVHVPIVHIEAGLRSFNKSMPEEINRIMADHVSTLLFSPTATGIKNLVREGFRKETKPPYSADNPAIFHCGDVMYDNSLHFAEAAEKQSKILEKHQLEKGNFVLATIHRNNNTDEPQRLAAIFGTLEQIAAEENIQSLMPLHPRTSGLLQKNLPADLYEKVMQNPNLILAPPVSFLDMVQLEKNARLIITDSGGVQKEAYFFGKPCIILRPQTEWVELVENGTAMIADANSKKIKKAFRHFSSDQQLTFPPIFGDGKAAEFICEKIIAS
ncbi:MAG: UDP-N-acetylglucosamine 2-epimerase (non-hydrolyzing) [Victivallaceae bacterium]